MAKTTKQLSKTVLGTKAGLSKYWHKAHRAVKPLLKNGHIWLIAVSLLVAAQATLIWAPKVGIYINAVALAGLVAIAVLKDSARKVAISTSILPVANMIGASLMLRSTVSTTSSPTSTTPTTITNAAQLNQAGTSLDSASAQLNSTLNSSSLNSDLSSML